MIKAVDKRLVVKKIEEEKKEGIIITMAQNLPFKAIVIAVGGNVDSKVSKADILILSPGVGTPIEIDGEKYLAIYEDQILAVVGQ